MTSSLFEAMATALIERPAEGNTAESVSDRPGISPTENDRPQHVGARSVVAGPTYSLLEVDPNTFYDSAWIRSKPRPSSPICTFGAHCGQTPAIIKCYSCARYQGGHGFYCGDCFKACHPWYRANHTWLTLEDYLREELEIHTYAADLERDVADIRGMLQNVSLWRTDMKNQHADTKGDDSIKEAARDATRVAIKIRDLAHTTCQDGSRVSRAAVEGVIIEAERFQKIIEARELFDGDSIKIAARETRRGGSQLSS